MVERLKDDADRKLEALFGPADVIDDGFSEQVMRRLRRQVWVRRLAMPVCLVIGLLFAAKPMVALFGVLSDLWSAIPKDLVESVGRTVLPTDNLPQLSTIFLACMLLAAVIMISTMLEE